MSTPLLLTPESAGEYFEISGNGQGELTEIVVPEIEVPSQTQTQAQIVPQPISQPQSSEEIPPLERVAAVIDVAEAAESEDHPEIIIPESTESHATTNEEKPSQPDQEANVPETETETKKKPRRPISTEERIKKLQKQLDIQGKEIGNLKRQHQSKPKKDKTSPEVPEETKSTEGPARESGRLKEHREKESKRRPKRSRKENEEEEEPPKTKKPKKQSASSAAAKEINTIKDTQLESLCKSLISVKNGEIKKKLSKCRMNEKKLLEYLKKQKKSGRKTTIRVGDSTVSLGVKDGGLFPVNKEYAKRFLADKVNGDVNEIVEAMWSEEERGQKPERYFLEIE